MMDRLTDEAQATGAVDTITRESTRLVGHNTDVVGFRAALDALVGRQKMPKQAVIIGAGGGARAAVYAFITNGFQRVIIFNRHLHRAEGLIRHFGRSAAHMELRAMPWHESVIESELAKTKILVNASALADAGDQSPMPAELLPPDLLVLDLMYQPRETKLMRDARAAGRHGSDERRHDAASPDCRGVQPVDRPRRAARLPPGAPRRSSRATAGEQAATAPPTDGRALHTRRHGGQPDCPPRPTYRI